MQDTAPDHRMFDAVHLARGWLSVALASGTDDARPALHRTVAVETFTDGVRLVATDSYVVLHAWVPNLDHDWAAEPEMDEEPLRTAVVMDPEGRARGLLAHLLKLGLRSRKDGLDPVPVRLALGVSIEAALEVPSFVGMDAVWADIEHPDHERVRLRVYEGSFPAWRRLFEHFTAEKAEVIALNPEIIGRLAKLGRYWPGCPLVWHFGGENRAAAIDVGHAENPVSGLVMPVRWDLDTNRPAPTDEPKAAKEGPLVTDGDGRVLVDGPPVEGDKKAAHAQVGTIRHLTAEVPDGKPFLDWLWALGYPDVLTNLTSRQAEHVIAHLTGEDETPWLAEATT